mgnify:CR=1 FL=1
MGYRQIVRVSIGLMLALSCGLSVAALAAGTPTTLYLPAISSGPAPTPAPSPTPGPSALIEQRIAELINAARLEQGLSPLMVDGALTRAARRHSADMAANTFFDHIGSDGSTPGQRIEEAGYSWYACGETIAAGHATPEDVVTAWLNSEGHREAILCPLYQDLGVGYVNDPTSVYGRYCTVDFARHAQ